MSETPEQKIADERQDSRQDARQGARQAVQDERQDDRQDKRADSRSVATADGVIAAATERQDASQHAERTSERKRMDRRMLVIFAVVVLAFSVVSLRTESQQHSIERTNARISAAQHFDCTVRNDSAQRFNKVLDTIITAVKASDSPPAEKAARIKIYTDAKAGVVDCDRIPASTANAVPPSAYALLYEASS